MKRFSLAFLLLALSAYAVWAASMPIGGTTATPAGLPSNNTFTGTNTFTRGIAITGSGNGIRFPDGSTQTTAGGGGGGGGGFSPYSSAMTPTHSYSGSAYHPTNIPYFQGPVDPATWGQPEPFAWVCTGDDCPSISNQWIDARAYPTLSDADAAAFAAGKVLVVSSQWDIVPSALNAAIKIIPGGVLNNSGSLTINSSFDAPPVTVFGVGDVTFSANSTREILTQWFGTVSDGSTDSTLPMQRTFRSAELSHIPISVQTGTTIVNAPLVSNLAASNTTPTIGFAIHGQEFSPYYNQSTAPSRIKAGASFPSQESILDLRYTRQVSIKYLGVDGNAGLATCLELGERSSSGHTFTGHIIEANSFANGYYGVRSSNAGISHYNYNNVSGNTMAGIALLQYNGDSDLNGNFVNTNNPDYIGFDYTTGSGIFVGSGSSNVNIRGGKVEWNAKGVTIYDATGVTVTGVNFDVDRLAHVVILGDSTSAIYTPSGINIVGNRFLSGGTNTPGSSLYASHIFINSSASNVATMRINISGNTMRKGGENATDLNTGTNIGPIHAGVKYIGPSPVQITANGNDMDQCSSLDTFWIDGGASGANTILKETGNDYGLPNFFGNGALHNNKSFTPTVVGTSTAGTASYSLQTGTSTVIGNRCFFNISLTWSGHTGTGNIQLAGLPFNSVGDSTVSITPEFAFTGPAVSARTSNSGTSIVITQQAATGTSTSIPLPASGTVRISGSYTVQ